MDNTAHTQREKIQEALAFINTIYVAPSTDYSQMSEDELKQDRLIKRGLTKKQATRSKP